MKRKGATITDENSQRRYYEKMIEGIIPALVTLFDDNGAVDKPLY